jgi:hypothetical protein
MPINKKGIVPRPAPSGYCAGTVENGHALENKKGFERNKVVEIAPSPEVHDRESSDPEFGIKRTKSSAHAHSGDHEVVRGRPYQYQEVRDAVAKPLDRKVKDQELGSNQRKGN